MRLNEKGRKEYMSYVKKAYDMMFFWIGFGGFFGFLSYSMTPQIRFIRASPRFKAIRLFLTLFPIAGFSYHGIKFMIFYKRKGAREVPLDPSNVL